MDSPIQEARAARQMITAKFALSRLRDGIESSVLWSTSRTARLHVGEAVSLTYPSMTVSRDTHDVVRLSAKNCEEVAK